MKYIYKEARVSNAANGFIVDFRQINVNYDGNENFIYIAKNEQEVAKLIKQKLSGSEIK